jgi:hypothetical protein
MLAPKSTAAAAGVSGAGLFAHESVAHPLTQALATVRSVRLDVHRAIANRSAITVAGVLFGAFMSRVIEWPVLTLRDRLFPSRSA